MAAKKTSKGRKIGRNKKWCEAYRNRHQRERNKVKKLLRHIRRYGTTDHMAVHTYNNLPVIDGKPYELLSITPTKSRHKRKAPRVPMRRDVPTPNLSRQEIER